ncbi:MAG: hypothetical protein Q3M24_00915 [Candidatus Electrothrix aestuarii]|uniref:Uncharacterized protein n=1 Tax=Candidatus Electrothrix aestuarii TaxID=3062594 RepID=A0AAU8LVZ4_9BACT|nr:hypothetical protein [Candidatus Electrothrix aestuarii]
MKYSATTITIIFIALFILLDTSLIFSQTNLKLQSGIDKTYKTPFTLNKDNFLRIARVFEKNKDLLNFPTAIVYRVKLEDNRFYETIDKNKVLNDPNTKNHCIDIVIIELKDLRKERETWERDRIASVAFNRSKQMIGVEIFAEERTWSLVFSDEIEPQIERTIGVKTVSSIVIVLFTFSIYFLVMLNLSKVKRKITSFQMKSMIDAIGLCVATMTALVLVFTFTRWNYSFMRLTPHQFIDLFGPKSAFLWGDMKGLYQEHEELIKNIKWVVVIGFVISLTANIIMTSLNRITLKNKDNSSMPTAQKTQTITEPSHEE